MFKKLKRRKFEKETSRKIKKLNKKLASSFSYAILIEETDILKKIPIKDNSTYLRNEHLNNVLNLLEKGLKEDCNQNCKKIENKKELNKLYNDVKTSYIKYLQIDGIIDKKIDNKPLDVEKDYETKYEDYTNLENENRLEKINYATELVEAFKVRLEKVTNPRYKYLNEDNQSKLNYYGPMSHYIALKKIDKNEKKLQKKKNNPFNHYRMYSWFFFLNFLKKKQEKKSNNNPKEYFQNELLIEEKRLNLEKYRIENSKENYDYYFDTYLWRILNDGIYLFKKDVGGIKKLLDKAKYASKEKGLFNMKEKEKIIIKDDELDLTYEPISNFKVKGGKANSNGGALDIKELNEEINKNVKKEFINEEVREMTRKK